MKMAHKVVDTKTATIDLTKLGGRTVLTPKRSITHENCEELETIMDDCFNQKRAEIILDFKGVSYLDSEALELLVKTHGELQGRGTSLKLVGINETCRDILLATRHLNLFRVYDDIHEAIRSGL